MEDTEHINLKAKERFCFLSLGKNLNVQRAWLLIAEYMSNQIDHAIEEQMVDNIFSLQDTASFVICRHEDGVFKEGEIIFHVPLSVTKVSPKHQTELFKQLNPPIVSIGGNNKCFCTILTTTSKPNIDLLISKEIAEYYSQWTINVNPELLTSSYSIPTYLYIINHFPDKHSTIIDLSDLSQSISAGKYEYFSDFEKRILKPVKNDFDRGLIIGTNSFTFDYEVNRKAYFGKKSEIKLTLQILRCNGIRLNEDKPIKNQHKMEATRNFDKYIQLLEANKNLILTGAPGTGKTFMAKEIAKEFITNTVNRYKNYNEEYLEATYNCLVLRNILDTQIMMVQFHPSYDYTDFVEGLRPTKNKEGQLGFERFDGVFKNFCKNPYKRFVIGKKSYNLDDKDNCLASDLGDLYYKCHSAAVNDIKIGFFHWQYFAEHIPTPIVSHYRNFSIEYKQYEDEENGIVDGETSWVDYPYYSCQVFCRVIHSFDNIFNGQYPSKEDIKKNLIEIWNKQIIPTWSLTSENEWKVRNYRFDLGDSDLSCPISNIDGVTDFYYTLFYWIIDYASRYYERVYLPSVFIIDEINRGEISKIFGELFFSIDPGYRGKEGKVHTQYQNMIDDADVFKDGFYVPENVYIIGTMNDIDRSVESMDFAMRRRFAFEEVTAKESYQYMIAESNVFSDDEKEEIKKRMFALNNAICKPELRLGEAYQRGAAYFRKYLYYKEYGMEQAFAMLWDYHLKGLLFEYLRGNQNAKLQLEELENAYNKKAETHEETDSDNR